MASVKDVTRLLLPEGHVVSEILLASKPMEVLYVHHNNHTSDALIVASKWDIWLWKSLTLCIPLPQSKENKLLAFAGCFLLLRRIWWAGKRKDFYEKVVNHLVVEMCIAYLFHLLILYIYLVSEGVFLAEHCTFEVVVLLLGRLRRHRQAVEIQIHDHGHDVLTSIPNNNQLKS